MDPGGMAGSRPWVPHDRTGGPLDDILGSVRERFPDATLSRMVGTHPADDANVFWIQRNGIKVQIDTGDGGGSCRSRWRAMNEAVGWLPMTRELPWSTSSAYWTAPRADQPAARGHQQTTRDRHERKPGERQIRTPLRRSEGPPEVAVCHPSGRLSSFHVTYAVHMQPPGEPSITCFEGGRDWRIGTDVDVSWIRGSTPGGLEITSAIPPLFPDYATIVVPDDARKQNTDLVVQVLREHSREQNWWLGFLDTNDSDLVFPEAPRVSLYAEWNYVLVLAGPDEASSWRDDFLSHHGPGPDLIFPTDRSWLMSWLWDDDWRHLGGTQGLINLFLDQSDLEVRRILLGEDATPPGHVAR